MQVFVAIIVAILVLLSSTSSYAQMCAPLPDKTVLARQKLFPVKREVIAKYGYLAMLSDIAYSDEGPGGYVLPSGWERLEKESYRDETGLFMAVFENAEAKEIVIAYRGTEGISAKDWKQNLKRFQPQSAPSVAATKAIIERHPERKVILTGHSLGGGLALENSFVQPNVAAVVFNSSPRIGESRKNYSNLRILFRERHEPLAVARHSVAYRRDNWGLKYDVLIDMESVEFTKHGITPMAKNLLAIGATYTEEVRKLYDLNCLPAQ